VPLGSHIRRMNPRDTTVGNLQRRKIIRRGATYGPALPEGAPEDGAEARGESALRLWELAGVPRPQLQTAALWWRLPVSFSKWAAASVSRKCGPAKPLYTAFLCDEGLPLRKSREWGGNPNIIVVLRHSPR
jgi:hypothetical protein